MGNSGIGIAGLVFFIVVAGHLMTWVTGSYAHWVLIIPGVLVGLLAVGSIR